MENALASTTKARIEHIKEAFPGLTGRQALQCLNMLKNIREESAFKTKKYEVARDMILKTLYLNWAKADRDIFDARLALFDSWTDFFISYTNRDAHEGNACELAVRRSSPSTELLPRPSTGLRRRPGCAGSYRRRWLCGTRPGTRYMGHKAQGALNYAHRHL